VRTAGFPCRVAGCERSFRVADQRSMDALMKASATRTAHEIADHAYHHVQLTEEPSRSPYPQIRRTPRMWSANGRK
jgi:hypothetical protein